MNEPKRWLSPVEKCDLCGKDLHEEEWFADARIPRYSAWGLVCKECALYEGVKFGTGRGQKYSSKKPYLKIEG